MVASADGGRGAAGVEQALARLEGAVERLAVALAAPRPARMDGAEPGVPRAAVAALAARLDATLAQLRAALAEQDLAQQELADRAALEADGLDEEG